MPKLVIDNQSIEVPEGTKVIEAAEALGIMIPRFCFHPALGAVGACRVCAVKFLEGPISGIEMSCMVNAKDGMVVSTTDAEAVDFRMHVIEWLMTNHPHDCPVCDEGGHCLLQDLTVSGGHSIRHYKGKKRTHLDQYLGPLVQHEMNRCIQCYRCVRYYQEYTGYMDLGVMGIGNRVYFGRYKEGELKSPFSGNLIDICPTGVFTDKPSRFTGRRWDFQRTPAICIHCSLGCHTTVSERYRQIVRQEARFSHTVNGHFICDRGRYGFQYVNDNKRPRKGRIQGREVSVESAVTQAIEKLNEIEDASGPDSVAVIASGRSSLETLTALRHLCRARGWQGPVFWNRKQTAQTVKTALCRLSAGLSVSMREIEPADAVLVAGADPLHEAPMAALAIRQAQRAGAKVAAIDPRPLEWPFAFNHLPCAPHDLASVLRQIRTTLADTPAGNTRTREGGEKASSASERDGIAAVVDVLRRSKRPVLIGGTDITDAETVAELAELAETLRNGNRQAGLFYILPCANSAGAALLDDSGDTAADLMGKIESGAVKALVAVESDLWNDCPDRIRLEQALERLELTVAVDCLETGLLDAADIQIPIQTIFESGGIHVNQEVRAQKSFAAFSGGLPISVTGSGGHPPRTFRPDIPGGDIPAAWQVLLGWAQSEIPTDNDALYRWMAETFPVLSQLARDFDDDGIRLDTSAIRTPEAQKIGPAETSGYKLLPTASIFGDEPLSADTPCLNELQPPPFLWMSSRDAAELGAQDGDTVHLELKTAPLELTVRISPNMSPGILVLPRRNSLFWQQFDETGVPAIDKDRLRIMKKA